MLTLLLGRHDTGELEVLDTWLDEDVDGNTEGFDEAVERCEAKARKSKMAFRVVEIAGPADALYQAFGPVVVGGSVTSPKKAGGR